jgi:hypothetical protein
MNGFGFSKWRFPGADMVYLLFLSGCSSPAGL